MKTFIKLWGILFILALAMPSMANAENHSIENHLSVSCADGDTIIPIPPIPIDLGGINKNGERSLPPIAGTYYNGEIELDFFANLGSLHVEVVNNSTGECWSEYVDSANGFATVDVSTSRYCGLYYITIYTNSNTKYIGEFLIE